MTSVPRSVELSVCVAFLDYLRTERRRSYLTARAYAADLRQFLGFLQGRSPVLGGKHLTDESALWGQLTTARPEERPALLSTAEFRGTMTAALCTADERVLSEFLAFLREEPYGEATVCRKVACLKSLYHWLVRMGLSPRNPASTLRPPRREPASPKIIPDDEVERLMASFNLSSVRECRDRAILLLVAESGLKTNEVVSLNWGSLSSTSANSVSVEVGAGRKRRCITVGPRVSEALQGYRTVLNQHHRTLELTASTPLFVNKSLERLSGRSLRRNLERYRRRAGVTAEITPNGLRVSRVRRDISRGTDLRELARRHGYSGMQLPRHLLEAS